MVNSFQQYLERLYLTIILIWYRSNRPGSRRPSERVIITIYGNQPDMADYAHLPEWTEPKGATVGQA